MAELQRGVVKWFNDAKGFGFIEHTSGRDVFVHYSVIEWDGFKTLKDGEEVHYELGEGDKGLHAAKVVRLVEAKEAETAESTAESSAESTGAENIEAGQIQTDGIETVSIEIGNTGNGMPELEVETTTAPATDDATVAPTIDGPELATTAPRAESVEK